MKNMEILDKIINNIPRKNCGFEFSIYKKKTEGCRRVLGSNIITSINIPNKELHRVKIK